MFNTTQQAFNHYRNESLENMESRAEEIKGTIETDSDADVATLKIEIEGLKEAMKNAQDKQDDNKNEDDEDMENRSFNPITDMNVAGNRQVPTENIFESNEYRSAFYKSMLGQQLTDVETRTFNQALNESESRADKFNTTSNSAAVLPTETLNEVISKARKKGGLLGISRDFNIPTNIKVPIGTPTNKAEWHEEGKEVDAEKADVVSVEFEGHEIIKLFSMSAATKKMSIEAFEKYLTDELTNAVMEAIADAMVNGDGKKKGTGIMEGVSWDDDNTVELSGKYTDFTEALAKLKKGYSSDAAFVMNNATLYNKVYALVDENKRPIFIADPQNDKVGRILGKEVVIDDHMDDNEIVLGDFNYMGYNLPEGLMIEVSRESSFRSGLVDMRAMAIADTKPLVEEAFVKIAESSGE